MDNPKSGISIDPTTTDADTPNDSSWFNDASDIF